MSSKLALKCVVVCAIGFLLAGVNASAQTSSIFKVSGGIQGNTQGVSVARCGPGIVAGFTDAESTASVAGYAFTKNASSFADGGVLPVLPKNPDSVSSSFLGPGTGFARAPGNPAVACSDQLHFYYASVFTDFDICPLLPCVAISVSASSDTGQTWGFPIVASRQDADLYDFEWPTMAVDPTNPSRLYVAYINVNGVNPFDGILGDCQGPFGGTILEFTSSSDRGKTWTPRTQLDHACAPPAPSGVVTGSLITPNIAVSPTGEVLIAYEFQAFNDGSGTPNQIRVIRSSDNGKTFGARAVISTTATANATPQLGVDRTVSANRGEIYLAWSGSPLGTYTDILVSESLDGGATFSFPRAPSGAPGAGFGRFEEDPTIAVDNDGQVAVCFYSTGSNTPSSSSIFSYNCGTSFNHAISWQWQRLLRSAPPGFNAVTSDFLMHNDGFITVFGERNSGVLSLFGEKFDTQ